MMIGNCGGIRVKRCGEREAEKLGITVLPMPFFIDGELFLEDITLNQEQFYQRLLEDADISTSQPAPADVTGLWEKLLEEYDEILHIPMSSGLSASCETAAALAQDYGGRVQVVNNQRISITQRQSVLDWKREIEEAFPGYDIHMDPLSLSVSCHIGHGALAIACAKRVTAD